MTETNHLAVESVQFQQYAASTPRQGATRVRGDRPALRPLQQWQANHVLQALDASAARCERQAHRMRSACDGAVLEYRSEQAQVEGIDAIVERFRRTHAVLAGHR